MEILTAVTRDGHARHLVKSTGMPGEHGTTHTTTACGRDFWAYPTDRVVEVTCKRCLASPGGRVLPAALAIDEVSRKWAPHPETLDMLTDEY